tara:strand:- start:9979 stop:10593 length:615 start_codon:yes stop_codon:yes gene_type:complete
MNNSERKDLRKKQILDAALNVVVQKGYSSSRMDDIVEESQLSKGTIYWYYKSKKDVFLSLVNYWVNNFSVTLNHIVEEDISASEQLKELFNIFLKAYEENPDVFKAELEFWSMANRDKDFKLKTQKVYHELLIIIEDILQKGVKTGEFKNIDVKVAALSIMINIEGIIWFTLFNTNGITPKHYVDTIADFILSGLTKKHSEVTL